MCVVDVLREVLHLAAACLSPGCRSANAWQRQGALTVENPASFRAAECDSNPIMPSAVRKSRSPCRASTQVTSSRRPSHPQRQCKTKGTRCTTENRNARRTSYHRPVTMTWSDKTPPSVGCCLFGLGWCWLNLSSLLLASSDHHPVCQCRVSHCGRVVGSVSFVRSGNGTSGRQT